MIYRFPWRLCYILLTACVLVTTSGSYAEEAPESLGGPPSSEDRKQSAEALLQDSRKKNAEADLILTEEDIANFEDQFIEDLGVDDDQTNDEDMEEYDDDEEDDGEWDEDDLWLFQYDPIEVGHVQDVEVDDGRMLQMKTLAINPPIFEIQSFLSHEECDHIMELANQKGLQTSLTVPDDAVPSEEDQEQTKKYFVELDQDEDGVLDPAELLEAIKMFTVAEDIDLTVEHIKELIELKLDRNSDGLVDVDEFIEGDTPAMEEEIVQWLVEIGDVGEKETKKSQARVSDQAWLDQWTTTDEVLLRLQSRVIDLTLLPSSIIQTSEHLQVVRYHPGGHYHAHYDSNDIDDELECAHTFGIEDENDERKLSHNNDFSQKRLCRIATVLYYLNDVEEGGGTAFPVADNETFTEESLDAVPYDIYDLTKNCYKSNVVVPPKKGKAILWYNHYLDEEKGWIGANRNHSLHGGCEIISGTKWIANNWINVDDNVDRQLLFQDRYFSLAEEQFQEGELTDSIGEIDSEVFGDDTRAVPEETAETDERSRSEAENLGNEEMTPNAMDEVQRAESKMFPDAKYGIRRSDFESLVGNEDDGRHLQDLEMKEEITRETLDSLSHRKARDKLNESNKKSNMFSTSQRSGHEFHSNDEL